MGRIFYFNITYRCNNDCLFCAANHGYNNTNNEMNLDEFKEIVKNNNIGECDRVIVNGGEPTTHTHFFELLDIIYAHKAYIDLYTNGVKLSDLEFSKKLLLYTPMLIRIPIFGASSQKHNRLTGMEGSFEKTIKGIKNIVGLKKDIDLKIEVKLLLSKATSVQNREIYNFFKNNFPNEFYFSFNPLLVSARVKQNANIMFESYTESVEKSLPLIQNMKNEGWDVSLSLLPFCLLPKEYYPGGVDRNIEETYFEPSAEKKVENKLCSEKCKYCSFKEICAGFPQSYLTYAGDDEVKPIYLLRK